MESHRRSHQQKMRDAFKGLHQIQQRGNMFLTLPGGNFGVVGSSPSSSLSTSACTTKIAWQAVGRLPGRVIDALALDQTLTRVGKSPIGLRPPSVLGKRTISTRSSACDQQPSLSAASSIMTSADLALLQRRRRARGDRLSAPRPVLMGNDAAASSTAHKVRGSGASSKWGGKSRPE